MTETATATDSHARILGWWEPWAEPHDDSLGAELEDQWDALSPAAHDLMYAMSEYVADYAPFVTEMEQLFERGAAPRIGSILDFDILAARRRGARPPFEPPPPVASLADEHDPLRNLSLACVLGLAICDGYGDPFCEPQPDSKLPLVRPHRTPAQRVRSTELARIMQVGSRELAAALRRIGIRQRGMRFTDPGPFTPGNTKGYERRSFKTVLSWLVQL
jgi:hypothetical protein